MLISFVAGTLVVLTILVAGLKLFNDRQMAPYAGEDAASASFTVEYLTPQEAAQLLGEPARGQSDRPAVDPAEPGSGEPYDD